MSANTDTNFLEHSLNQFLTICRNHQSKKLKKRLSLLKEMAIKEFGLKESLEIEQLV